MLEVVLLAGVLATALTVRGRLRRRARDLPARMGPRQQRRPDRVVDLRLPRGSVTHRVPGYPGTLLSTMSDQDKPPRNLKAMLSEAKDTSELMVDLAYAALFFDDEAHGRRGPRARGAPERPRARDARDLRARGALAPRSRADVERPPRRSRRSSGWRTPPSTSPASSPTASGIPADLVADLAAAEEVSHRVRVRADSALAQRSLADVELPVEVGMRVVAIRRGKEWHHRPRRRRHAPARRRADPPRPARRHRRAARRSPARPSGARPSSTRTRRSPTSTAPSTCSSR